MKNSVKERELKQFKWLMRLGVIVYPLWFSYGVWSGNYQGPIIVGFMTAWAVWYIKFVKMKTETHISEQVENIDWYKLPIDEYLNLPVLVISLSLSILGCIVLLLVIQAIIL